MAGTATADFKLQPEFSEQVEVTAETPLVDVASSGPTVAYDSEFLKDLPTSRNFYDIMAVSPDVSLAAEDEDRLVAGGSNVQSNSWFIDGIETKAPETGTAWIYVNPDSIEEVQVMHIGAPAEYGNMLGAALNVVTKSGSNEFKGGVNIYWFDDSLVDSQIDFDSEFPEYHMDEFWDASFTLGGPFIKDRLWFFASYEYFRENQTFPGADPAETPNQYADRSSLKLTAQLNEGNLLEVKGSYDDWGYPPPASAYIELSALAGEKGIDKSWGINYQSIFSDRTFFEARYTGFKVEDKQVSETGSTEPAYIDYSPPGGGPALYFGGAYYPFYYDTSLDQLSVSVSHFADDFIAGDHDFKFGIQAEPRRRHRQGRGVRHRHLLLPPRLRVLRNDLRLLLQGRRPALLLRPGSGVGVGLRRRLVEAHRPPHRQPRPALRLPQGQHPRLRSPRHERRPDRRDHPRHRPGLHLEPLVTAARLRLRPRRRGEDRGPGVLRRLLRRQRRRQLELPAAGLPDPGRVPGAVVGRPMGRGGMGVEPGRAQRRP